MELKESSERSFLECLDRSGRKNWKQKAVPEDSTFRTVLEKELLTGDVVTLTKTLVRVGAPGPDIFADLRRTYEYSVQVKESEGKDGKAPRTLFKFDVKSKVLTTYLEELFEYTLKGQFTEEVAFDDFLQRN